MKLIETFKSPNFNERESSQNFYYLIIHYTAMKSCFEALEYMCEKKNKVSSHFLISKKGEVFYLVDLKKRAWHAGQSFWQGISDLNSYSIGIGTQLMLLSSNFNLQFGIYDIGHTLRDKLTTDIQLLNPNIYLKIGYDRLPF